MRAGAGCVPPPLLRDSAREHAERIRSLAMTESAAATKSAPNRLIALWGSVIGKKVVMAATGGVLILFVLAHMAGNLKIFSGPTEINDYSRFLRTVAYPELAYGQLLWIVRAVLLV